MICSVCSTIVQVHTCARCFTPVCARHAGFAHRDEYQYDKESWVCLKSCPGLALVPYDPRFHTFDWTTVADAAEQALINECGSLRASIQATTKDVLEAATLFQALIQRSILETEKAA